MYKEFNEEEEGEADKERRTFELDPLTLPAPTHVQRCVWVGQPGLLLVRINRLLPANMCYGDTYSPVDADVEKWLYTLFDFKYKVVVAVEEPKLSEILKTYFEASGGIGMMSMNSNI